MAEHALIKLVPHSEKESISLMEIKDLLHYYQDITAKTGQQIDWNYAEKAFPYAIKELVNATGDIILHLRSTDEKYRHILIGVGQEWIKDYERTQTYIHVSLPSSSTFGDKGKANEIAKFLGKELKGELYLFNHRIMYFYPTLNGQ